MFVFGRLGDLGRKGSESFADGQTYFNLWNGE